YVASDARVCGDVEIGPGGAVLSGAVLTAEGGPVSVGKCCVVMERAVVRGVPGHACELGDHVLVGPGAHLAGCAVEDRSFLATGVTVLNGARIGRLADVRINAVVHVRTRLPPETTIPIGWVAVGDPAEVYPPGAHDRIWAVQRTLRFRDAAFRMDDLPRERFMEEMTRRYARALARHRDDRPLSWREFTIGEVP
ncbi:MAG: gamma carbonic anhydrase family protein, partial [Gemmatimonadota bacterium]